MDFEEEHADELREFASKVSAWLDRNAPLDARPPLQSPLYSAQLHQWGREFQRRLADHGWAAPSWPGEHGGAGLTPYHDAIVRDEIESRGIPLLYETNRRAGQAVLAWGSPGQKGRLLRPLALGESTVWWSLSLGRAVADPGCASVTAVKDGDVYLVSGEDVFQTAPAGDTHLWTVAVTDPEARPQRRLSAFLIPVGLSGITLESGPEVCRRRVALDLAPVPTEYLVGGEGDGWLVAHSTLEVEEYADRALKQQRAVVQRLIGHFKESVLGRRPEPEYKHKRELVAEAYINSHVLRVLSLRNRWMRSTTREMTFHGPQYFLLAKDMADRLSAAALDVMGPCSLTADSEWAPMPEEGLRRAETLDGAHPFAADAQEQFMRMWLGLQAGDQGAATS